MNEISIKSTNLPNNIEELTKFVLVGREKLTAVKAEIRAIDKIGLAKEVKEQKRAECLMLSEALLDAEVKIGDLLKRIPAQPRIDNIRSSSSATSGHDKSFNKDNDSCLENIQTDNNMRPEGKHAIIKELGFNKDQVQRFETLAEKS